MQSLLLLLDIPISCRYCRTLLENSLRAIANACTCSRETGFTSTKFAGTVWQSQSVRANVGLCEGILWERSQTLALVLAKQVL